jgi:hypothetical protein
LGINNDATIESHDKARIKVYVTPDKLHFKLVITMFRYCIYTVRESIALTFTPKDDFDGVLELLFFTDSDHVGNADGTSNSGMGGISKRKLPPRLLLRSKVFDHEYGRERIHRNGQVPAVRNLDDASLARTEFSS